jgi:hypothetical protein
LKSADAKEIFGSIACKDKIIDEGDLKGVCQVDPLKAS